MKKKISLPLMAIITIAACILRFYNAYSKQVDEKTLEKAFAPYLERADKQQKAECGIPEDAIGGCSSMSEYIIGDINKDGINDGIVRYECSCGGNAAGSTGLAIFLVKNRKPELVNMDFYPMIPEKIENGIIYCKRYEYGPNDARCCPSIVFKEKYQLINNKLSLIKDKPALIKENNDERLKKDIVGTFYGTESEISDDLMVTVEVTQAYKMNRTTKADMLIALTTQNDEVGKVTLKYKITLHGTYNIKNAFLTYDWDIDDITTTPVETSNIIDAVTTAYLKDVIETHMIPELKKQLISDNKEKIIELNRRHLKTKDSKGEETIYKRM